jgi:hypothetical protein
METVETTLAQSLGRTETSPKLVRYLTSVPLFSIQLA